MYCCCFGIARASRHLLNPRCEMIFAFCWRSRNSFSPTIPISAIPFATLCGMSSSRRYSISSGKFVACWSSVLLL